MLTREQMDAAMLARVRRMVNRTRTGTACFPCKAKKTKCNDYRPCNKCLISGQSATGQCLNNSLSDGRSSPTEHRRVSLGKTDSALNSMLSSEAFSSYACGIDQRDQFTDVKLSSSSDIADQIIAYVHFERMGRIGDSGIWSIPSLPQVRIKCSFRVGTNYVDSCMESIDLLLSRS